MIVWQLSYYINRRDFQIKNDVNNVDMLSLRTPWQNSPYENKQKQTHRTAQKHTEHKDKTNVQKKKFVSVFHKTEKQTYSLVQYSLIIYKQWTFSNQCVLNIFSIHINCAIKLGIVIKNILKILITLEV